jgi:S-adenosyl-L-methionine hydrolase (adenosine-forming)
VAARAGGSVFFLTDYGLTDEFAGVMRAVVLRHAPGVSIIDLTHGVPPFDVRAGALALARAVPHLGPGVVLAVVDPGVGTQRRAMALSVARARDSGGPHHFVGPDNGLLPWAVDALGGVEDAVALPWSSTFSTAVTGATFDGRDVFAPAAARLCLGAPLADLGEDFDPGTMVRLAAPVCSPSAGALEAEVLWVDRFGNVQLAAVPDDATAARLGSELEVLTAVVHRAQRVRSFGALAPGALGVVVDANGHLALVCDRQSAATVLRVQPGDVVTLRAPAPGSSSP